MSRPPRNSTPTCAAGRKTALSAGVATMPVMILVTGAGGAVGSALLETLQAAGHPVRAAYHAQRDVDVGAAAGRDAVRIDLGEPATLPPALRDVQAVFLIGAMSL